MDEKSIELLNSIYKDLSEHFGMDVAMQMYTLYKGTQITFPMRFFNPEMVKKCILQEFNGNNIKQLAVKYSYSEKSIRRVINESLKNKKREN